MENVSSKVIEQINKKGVTDLDQLDAYCVHNGLAYLCNTGKTYIFSNETGERIKNDKPLRNYNHAIKIVKCWYNKHN